MDVQLQELIDKIKKDGVASAENSSATIIAEAEKKAAQIVAEAEAKAESILKNAKAETERMEKSSKDAIAQAGRNLLISFRDGVTVSLDALIKKDVSKAYNADMLKTLIPETVKAWASKGEDDISVLLSEKDLATLEAGFTTSLKEEIANGLVIKADSSVASGFKVGVQNGAAFYDFSSEAVAELFASYLNPVTAKILKEAASE